MVYSGGISAIALPVSSVKLAVGSKADPAACDGETKSEIVVPLRIPLLQVEEDRVIGVLDLDSTSLGTFDEADRKGLEEIVAVLRDACDWS